LSEDPDPALQFGYIIPYWDDQNLAGAKTPPGFNTSLLLPLERGQRADVRKALQQLAPETILFLSKIRRINVEIEGSNHSSFEVEQNSGQHEIVTLSQNNQPAHSFWLQTQSFSTASLEDKEEKREVVMSRRVSVALPLDNYIACKGTDAYFRICQQKRRQTYLSL
jgi:hypothetical protein